jgi:hypothetical protein
MVGSYSLLDAISVTMDQWTIEHRLLFLRRLFKRVVRWCLRSADFVLTSMLVDMAPYRLDTHNRSGRRTSGQLDL